MADYDAGELTDREKLAGKNQIEIAKQNADDVRNQLSKQLETYDFANRQNRTLADVQLKQNSRKNSADRFEAQRDLQNAAIGLLGSMGPGAMNSSSMGNFMSMMENRNDKENNTHWAQLQSNQDQVENSYADSFNQNQVAKRDAVTSAEKAIRDIESDLSANLNNINPNLYEEPGSGETNLDSGSVWNGAGNIQQNNAQVSGYIMPDNRQGAARNRIGGNDYFSKLINRFNGR